MQGALASIDGVEVTAVDFESKTATIVCTDCDRAALAAALKAKGFGCSVQE